MNTKKLGDKGLGSAIAYYTNIGYTVMVPLTDSQDYDLVVDNGKYLEKVQVKFTSYKRRGNYQISLAIKGGTSGGTVKKADDIVFDTLFVAADSGELWSIPRAECKGQVILNSTRDKFKV